MRLFALALLAAAVLLASGCATTAPKVGPDMEKLPARAEGEVAVFGSVRLIEFVARAPMASPDQDASVYLVRLDPTSTSYKVKCSDTGEFGAYLPEGSYDVSKISVAGFTFEPDDLTLVVPGGHDAAYVGTVVMDGTPSGVTAGNSTRFVMTVKDEYREFATGLRKAGISEAQVVKSLLRPGSAFASGGYPTKVMRAKDVENELAARTGAVEEVAKGVLISIPYVLSPVWILTLP